MDERDRPPWWGSSLRRFPEPTPPDPPPDEDEDEAILGCIVAVICIGLIIGAIALLGGCGI